jgi:hypothetical protein
MDRLHSQLSVAARRRRFGGLPAASDPRRREPRFSLQVLGAMPAPAGFPLQSLARMGLDSLEFSVRNRA